MHDIDTAMALATRRLERWQRALDNLAHGPVEVATLTKKFPGIDEEGGEFRVHLELAALAIALQKRVIMLQAVEAAQMDASNPFASFIRALKADQDRIDKL